MALRIVFKYNAHDHLLDTSPLSYATQITFIVMPTVSYFSCHFVIIILNLLIMIKQLFKALLPPIHPLCPHQIHLS